VNYEFHEFAGIFPFLEADEAERLASDIKANGLREPIWIFEGAILDGRNRYRACRAAGIEPQTRAFHGTREDALHFVVSMNLERRHLNVSQRAMLILDVEEKLAVEAKKKQEASRAKPGEKIGSKAVAPVPPPTDDAPEPKKSAAKSRDTAAKQAGVGARTVQDAKKVKKKAKTSHGAKKLMEAVQAGSLPVKTAAGLIEESEEVQASVAEKVTAGAQPKQAIKQARQEARKAESIVLAATVPAVSDRYRLITSSVEALAAQVEHASIDWIITDPPYPKEYINVYGDLSMLAESVLKPGGSLLVMAGQSYLPEVIDQLSTSLRYHWALAYLTPGGQAPHLFDRKVNTFWKPVLWFTKGQYHGATVGDVVKSAVNDNDKRFHHWGQSESGIAELIEKFTKPGDMILDPFVGGGSTAAVAVTLGRQFIGADISADAISMTKARLAEVA